MTTPLNFEALDPAYIAVLLAGGVRPCICEGLGKKMDTIEEAAAYKPPWVRSYCLSHGTQKPVPHDLKRFPQAKNSYSCDSCISGDHVACRYEVRLTDWSCPCSCFKAAEIAHREVKNETKRNALALVIYAQMGDERAHDFWLRTDDGTPNSASYNIAAALIEAGLAR